MAPPFVLSVLCALQLFSYLTRSTHAYTFKFQNNPTQCSKLEVSIEGDDGQPPYNLLLIPYGQAPGQFETRSLETHMFNNSGKQLDFWMNYPAGSQFVAVVTDANRFASGGVSEPWTVKSSNDGSCFDGSQTKRPRWPFFYLSTDGLRSCEDTRVYWNSSNPNITGTPNFSAVIPGGQGFNLTQGSITDVPNETTGTSGFSWKVPVNPMTDLLLLSGDAAGTGGGGFVQYRVAPPQDVAHTNCFPNMPSRTPAPAAGGDPSADLSSGGTNIGPIIGGVVAGVVVIAGLAIGIWLLMRKRRREREERLNGGHVTDLDASRHNSWNLPQPYPMAEHHISPYSPTVPTTPGYTPNTTTFSSSAHGQMPYSSQSIAETNPLLVPSSKQRQQQQQYAQNQVNYVQHEDADEIQPTPGPSARTVDLPPAYNPDRPPTSSVGGDGQSTFSRSTRSSGDGQSRSAGGLKPSYYGDKKVRPLPATSEAPLQPGSSSSAPGL